MRQVFFSYAAENRAVVDAYVAAFERLGIDVWIDHTKINHGESIVELLNKAIDECDVAVVFFSEAYARKPWTNEEQRALLYEFVESNRVGAEQRTIFVVKLDDTPLPPMLRHRLWRGSNDVATIAGSIADWIGVDAQPEQTTQNRVISAVPNELGGVALEQLAVQLVNSIRDMPSSKIPIRLPVFVKGHGQVAVECMPRPTCDGVVEDISSRLYRCNSHRRQIGAHQRRLADGGLGIFDESFRIAMDQQIERLDAARFGTSSELGLRELLDGLILAVYEI